MLRDRVVAGSLGPEVEEEIRAISFYEPLQVLRETDRNLVAEVVMEKVKYIIGRIDDGQGSKDGRAKPQSPSWAYKRSASRGQTITQVSESLESRPVLDFFLEKEIQPCTPSHQPTIKIFHDRRCRRLANQKWTNY